MFDLVNRQVIFEIDTLHQNPCSIVHYQKDKIRDMGADMVGMVDISSTLPQATKEIIEHV